MSVYRPTNNKGQLSLQSFLRVIPLSHMAGDAPQHRADWVPT